jgi:hypothetical protein
LSVIVVSRFTGVLRHRAGAFPKYWANGPEALAGTLTAPGQRANAAKLAAVGGAIRARHGLVTPRWLTAVVAGQEHLASPWFPKPPFVTDDEAIALALTYDGI